MESQSKEHAAVDNDALLKESDGTSSPKELKNALYARCAREAEGTQFGQEDLLSFGIVPNNDVQELHRFTKQLMKEGLLRLMKKEDGKACWRVVKKVDAAKWVCLSVVGLLC